jgi:quercetin dioxygenase-like cupin family protein
VYRTVDAESLEGRRKLIARELGAQAVKLNRFDSQPGQEGFAHDELGSGQEEIYVPVAGSGRLVVGSDEVELVPGRFVLVSPEETRQVIAGSEGSRTWSSEPWSDRTAEGLLLAVVAAEPLDTILVEQSALDVGGRLRPRNRSQEETYGGAKATGIACPEEGE